MDDLNRRSFLKLTALLGQVATATPAKLPDALSALAKEATAAATAPPIAAAAAIAAPALSSVPTAARMLCGWQKIRAELSGSEYRRPELTAQNIHEMGTRLLTAARAVDKAQKFEQEYTATLDREKSEGKDTITIFKKLTGINTQIEAIHKAKTFLESNAGGMDIKPATQASDILLTTLQLLRDQTLAEAGVDPKDNFTKTMNEDFRTPLDPDGIIRTFHDKISFLSQDVIGYANAMEWTLPHAGKEFGFVGGGKISASQKEIAYGIALLEKTCAQLEKEHGIDFSKPVYNLYVGSDENHPLFVSQHVNEVKEFFLRYTGETGKTMLAEARKKLEQENTTVEPQTGTSEKPFDSAKRYTLAEAPSSYGLHEILRRQAGEPTDDRDWMEEVRKNTPKQGAEKGID